MRNSSEFNTSSKPNEAPAGQCLLFVIYAKEEANVCGLLSMPRNKAIRPKRSSFEKRQPKEYLVHPAEAKRAPALLEQVIRLSYVERFPSSIDQKPTNQCPYHGIRGHPLHQFVVFRRLFDEKLKAGEILLPEGGTANIHQAPFRRHQDQGKDHVMMAYHLAACAKSVTPKGEPKTDGYKNLVNLVIFMTRWTSVSNKFLAIMKTVIDLIDPSGGFASHRAKMNRRQQDRGHQPHFLRE